MLTVGWCETLLSFGKSQEKKDLVAKAIARVVNVPAHDVKVTFVSGDASISIGFDIYITQQYCEDEGDSFCFNKKYFVQQYMQGSNFDAMLGSEIHSKLRSIQANQVHLQYTHVDEFQYENNLAAYKKAKGASKRQISKSDQTLASAWGGATNSPSALPTHAPTTNPLSPLKAVAQAAFNELHSIGNETLRHALAQSRGQPPSKLARLKTTLATMQAALGSATPASANAPGAGGGVSLLVQNIALGSLLLVCACIAVLRNVSLQAQSDDQDTEGAAQQTNSEKMPLVCSSSGGSPSTARRRSLDGLRRRRSKADDEDLLGGEEQDDSGQQRFEKACIGDEVIDDVLGGDDDDDDLV